MRHLLIVTILLLSYQVFGQVNLNITFPDYIKTTAQGNKVEESTDWEFAQAKMELKDNNSTFSIVLYNQRGPVFDTVQSFELIQISEWIRKDNIDVCATKSTTGNQRYILYFLSSPGATNETWITLAELADVGFNATGNKLDLKNFNKRERETIMYLNSDGLSAYHYVQHYYSGLISSSLTIARNFVEDSIELSYSSKETLVTDEKKWLNIRYPVEVPYQSALIHRNISRNLSFKDGVYTYRNDSVPNENKTYGMATGTNAFGFDSFKYSWFVPKNIEILACRANVNGSWDRIENGIIFNGEKGVNNVLVEIKFKIKNTPAKEIEKTETVVKEVINIPGKKAVISVWDNAREDGDIISLSLNGEWIIRNLEVKKCQTTFTIDLPYEENYLIMKAENLGSSPPNTAAFLISSGDFNKQIILNSDMGKSEMIVLKRE